MRYVRFMSIEELNKYLSGEKLKNNTVWRDRGDKTDSVGFCFFDDSESPEERLEYYSRGITCTTDVWAVFEQIGGEPLKSVQEYTEILKRTMQVLNRRCWKHLQLLCAENSRISQQWR